MTGVSYNSEYIDGLWKSGRYTQEQFQQLFPWFHFPPGGQVVQRPPVVLPPGFPPKPTPGTVNPKAPDVRPRGYTPNPPTPHPWNPTPTTIATAAPWMNAAPTAPGPTIPPGLPTTGGEGPLTMKDPMSVISDIASGNYAWTPNQQGGGGATVPDSVNKMFNPQGQQNKNNYWGDISSQVWQT